MNSQILYDSKYEMSTVGKAIKTESRSVVSRDEEVGGVGENWELYIWGYLGISRKFDLKFDTCNNCTS
jgi:hypothetical protein